MFETLTPQPADSLLSLIRLFQEDPRADKIDLGVGVYRDALGNTPVFRAVKAAERVLMEEQPSKAYLGPEGDTGFLEMLRPLVLGDAVAANRVVALQTPGGTGALRLAGELIARTGEGRRIWVGRPTWPVHDPIFRAARLTIVDYDYFDMATQAVRFDALKAAITRAKPGDSMLLHGCCHNPTGADLGADEWREIAALIAERGVLPLLDLAYQGLGEGFVEDAAGVRTVLAQVPEALIAYSCDKNFGLYRERTGALFAVTNATGTDTLSGNLFALARGNWSMPPDHGAAVVRTILESPPLRESWAAELTEMRERIAAVRAMLAAAGQAGPVDLAPIGRQHGLFATLKLDPDTIARLRSEHAIYMAGSGRINIAGLTADNVGKFIAALAAA